MRNGLQNGKEQQEFFTGLERLSLDSEIVFQKKSTSCLGDEDGSEALLLPLPLAWNVMGELHLSTGAHLFHIPKVQREDPSVTSQIRQTQPDPFPYGPFHGRALLV